MAGCKPQIFTGIDATTLAALQARGAAVGLPIAGNTGQAATMGVTIAWNYDPETQVLGVECIDAPFFVPCSTIAAKVQELVDACRPKNA